MFFYIYPTRPLRAWICKSWLGMAGNGNGISGMMPAGVSGHCGLPAAGAWANRSRGISRNGIAGGSLLYQMDENAKRRGLHITNNLLGFNQPAFLVGKIQEHHRKSMDCSCPACGTRLKTFHEEAAGTELGKLLVLDSIDQSK